MPFPMLTVMSVFQTAVFEITIHCVESYLKPANRESEGERASAIHVWSLQTLFFKRRNTHLQ